MLYISTVNNVSVEVRSTDSNNSKSYPLSALAELKSKGVSGVFIRASGELFAVPMTACGSGIVKYLGTVIAPSEYQGVVQSRYSRVDNIGELKGFTGVCLGDSGSTINFSTSHIEVDGSWLVKANSSFNLGAITCLLVSGTTQADARLPIELAARVPNINAYLDQWMKKKGFAIPATEANYNSELNMVKVPKRLHNTFCLTLPKTVFLDRVNERALERLRYFEGKVVVNYSSEDLATVDLGDAYVFGTLGLKDCAGEYLLSCSTVYFDWDRPDINLVPLLELLAGAKNKLGVNASAKRYFPDVEIRGNTLVLTCMQGTISFDIDALTQDNIAGVSDANVAMKSTRNLLFKDVGISYDVTNNGVLRSLRVDKKGGAELTPADIVSIPPEVKYISSDSQVFLSPRGGGCTLVIPQTLETLPSFERVDRRYGSGVWYKLISGVNRLILDTDRVNIVIPFMLESFKYDNHFEIRRRNFGCTLKGDIATMCARLWITMHSAFSIYYTEHHWSRVSSTPTPKSVAVDVGYRLFSDNFEPEEDMTLDIFQRLHPELANPITFLSSLSDSISFLANFKPKSLGNLAVPREVGRTDKPDAISDLYIAYLGIRVSQRTHTTSYQARGTNAYGAYARLSCLLYTVFYLAELFGVYKGVLNICANPTKYRLDAKAKEAVKVLNKFMSVEANLSDRVMAFRKAMQVPRYWHYTSNSWVDSVTGTATDFPDWSK